MPAEIPSIRSPVSAEAPTPTTAAINVAQQSLGNLGQGAVGQAFQAQVLAQLEDGSFLVNVADNPLRMALPAGSSVGETLDMTLLATEPRPAFLLDAQAANTSTSLSSAAKLINTALQAAQQAGASTALAGKAPLLASSSELDTGKLANALQDSIEYSGVFYESHVGQWASGDRLLTDLLREPQMQGQSLQTPSQVQAQAPQSQTLSQAQLQTLVESLVDAASTLGAQELQELYTPPAPSQNAANLPVNTGAAYTASAGNATAAGTEGTVLSRPPATDEQLTNLMNTVRSNAESRPSLVQTLSALLSVGGLPKEADTVVRSPVMTQENAQNINLQLNAMEQQRIAWRGELWPGQRMEWEIQEEQNGSRQGNSGSDGQQAWQSTVRFDLPKLGKVSASIRLAGGHVTMQVSARSGDSVALLKTRGAELASALDAAGTPLDLLTVQQEDPQ